jgi:hypothetical protein
MSHHGKNLNHGVPEANLPATGPASIGESAIHEGQIVNPTHRTSPQELTTQVNRPQGPGAGIHRGDRRDTHPSYSTGKGGRGSTAGKARNGGRSGPLGASGRKSGPQAN